MSPRKSSLIVPIQNCTNETSELGVRFFTSSRNLIDSGQIKTKGSWPHKLQLGIQERRTNYSIQLYIITPAHQVYFYSILKCRFTWNPNCLNINIQLLGQLESLPITVQQKKSAGTNKCPPRLEKGERTKLTISVASTRVPTIFNRTSLSFCILTCIQNIFMSEGTNGVIFCSLGYITTDI